MDKEMATLKSRDMCEPVPRVKGLRTLKLDWVLHRTFKNSALDKNKVKLVARCNQ